MVPCAVPETNRMERKDQYTRKGGLSRKEKNQIEEERSATKARLEYSERREEGWSSVEPYLRKEYNIVPVKKGVG